MGLTRSYFGTPYKVPVDEFHKLESDAMELSLRNYWIKIPLFSEPSSHFIPDGLTLIEAMTPFTKLICHHVLLGIGAFPPVKSTRSTGKLYVLFYRQCIALSRYKLADGILLFRELNAIDYPDIAVITKGISDELSEPKTYQDQIGGEILLKQAFRAEALSDAHFSHMSIFSNNFEISYREAFFKEFGYLPATEAQLSRLFPTE
jgi:hypothetical protein